MTREDLTRYRAIWAVCALLFLPSFAWAADYPASLWSPPPGPFQLLSGSPSWLVLTGLEVALAVAIGCLIFGVWVEPASVVATALLLTGLGVTYSFGKIDHSVLFVVAPLFLVAAGWAGGRGPSPWVMRLFAFTIGLAMLTAAMAKLGSGGWADLSTHATEITMRSYVAQGEGGPMGPALLNVLPGWAWEAQDWLTLVLECGLVVAAVSIRAFRAWLAALCLFHVAIGFSLGIWFGSNPAVYAAFVPWGRLPRWRQPSGGLLLAAVVGVGAWLAYASTESRAWANMIVTLSGLVLVPLLLLLPRNAGTSSGP